MNMDLNKYQKLAGRTARLDAEIGHRRIVATLGLCGEAGEFADHVKKIVGHDHPLQEERMKSELGDVLWYVAEVCSSFGWSLGDVAYENLLKLKRRYPDGFDAEKSLNRTEQHATFVNELESAQSIAPKQDEP
jgi:NTP pyrophosphatase (non-canonical NTP hydrolase)